MQMGAFPDRRANSIAQGIEVAILIFVHKYLAERAAFLQERQTWVASGIQRREDSYIEFGVSGRLVSLSTLKIVQITSIGISCAGMVSNDILLEC